ncbi:hypothetical protein [Maricaulis sp.]|uniref:hypothetical protein n=1 Tax=unclassified Maricaulis TaxID=2632371 RepID=UPI001B155929|nr:hypothetical protein [Maricaulis sp.]MBO6796483.1 hypothetical protein [Maricaulis sp.]
MVVKSIVVASVLATLSAVPVAVPALTGTSVNLALGPFEATFNRHLEIDFGVRGECITRDCSFMELAFGDGFRLVL